MKIYTKNGDKGQTSLIGGKRVPKYHKRIETYGTIDELISYIGLIRDQPVDKKIQEVLIGIQENLMVCASLLAAGSKEEMNNLPKINEQDIVKLENEIDDMEKDLTALTSFMLPGGNTYSSYCHIARSVCRRAERLIIKLARKYYIPLIVIQYFNRLSDYLFVLARKLNKDFDGVEIAWRP